MKKEELYIYFIKENHTLKECADFFGCSFGQIRTALKRFEIKKEQEKEINKEELYRYYIIENHTLEDTMKYFAISKTCLCSKFKKFKIKKPNELKKERAVIANSSKKNNIDKNELYNKYIIENLTIEKCAQYFSTSTKSIIRRLKEYEIKKSKEKHLLNIITSFENKYGFKHPSQVEEFKLKMFDTNMKEYGVPYACMREECRKYSGNNSIPNKLFADLLTENKIEFKREFSLGNYSYDFKVGNYLFEINPSAFHNSTFSPVGNPKSVNYHREKSEVAKGNGYNCVNIWDWDDKNKIISLFLVKRDTFYARKCYVKEIDINTAKEFINKYHLQGYAKDKIRIGLFSKEENRLLSVITLGKPRYNKNFQYELVRYCSNANVIGGAEKMFKYFIEKYSPESIVSYCDLSKFNGNIYKKLGFSLIKNSVPSKHWYNIKTRKHITDNLLRQRGFDQLFGTKYGKGSSNDKLMIEYGFVEIYDCGQATFEWRK